MEKRCIPILSNKILKQKNVADLDHVELLHLQNCPSSFHSVLGYASFHFIEQSWKTLMVFEMSYYYYVFIFMNNALALAIHVHTLGP